MVNTLWYLFYFYWICRTGYSLHASLFGSLHDQYGFTSPRDHLQTALIGIVMLLILILSLDVST